jgi:multiple sugar transport system ATP-binding protein
MDEPLSNLDAKLRVQMRAEIHKLQRELAVTTIYVTHDQTEAMTMGDRVAVMRSGHLQQVDNPERLYERPANQFVAGFIGSPAMNIVRAKLARSDEGLVVGFGEHRLALDDAFVSERPALLDYEGRHVILGIRPEDMEDAAFAPDVPARRRLAVVCSLREALGSEVLLHFSIAAADVVVTDDEEFVEPLDEGSVFVARVNPRTAVREGQQLQLAVDTMRMHFFDPDSGGAIYGQRSAQVARGAGAVSG